MAARRCRGASNCPHHHPSPDADSDVLRSFYHSSGAKSEALRAVLSTRGQGDRQESEGRAAPCDEVIGLDVFGPQFQPIGGHAVDLNTRDKCLPTFKGCYDARRWATALGYISYMDPAGLMQFYP